MSGDLNQEIVASHVTEAGHTTEMVETKEQITDRPTSEKILKSSLKSRDQLTTEKTSNDAGKEAPSEANLQPEKRKSVKYTLSDEQLDIQSVNIHVLAELMKRETNELAIEDIFSLKSEGKSEDTVSVSYLKTPARYPDFAQGKDFEVDNESIYSFLMKHRESDVSLSKEQSPEKSSESIHKEDEKLIDRNMYYELHKLYTANYNKEKWKNNYLQKKLAQYYNRRRMYHVFIMDKSQHEYAKMYEKLLESLATKQDEAAREQASLESEISVLRNKHRAQSEEVDTLFAQLQQAEAEISKQFSYTALNAPKIVERYLKRQRLQLSNFREMHLAFIKLRNKYNETQDILDSLDNLGPNCRLIDYEQLKTDNRNLYEKLEEKELYLTSIRQECRNVMQILAHTREKSNVLNLDIKNYQEQLDGVLTDCMDAREQLSMLKHERDYIRRQINKLKLETGLLGRPKLLRDLERSDYEVQEGLYQLEEYKEACKAASDSLIAMKKYVRKMGVKVQTNKMSKMSKSVSFCDREP
ncbi:coiled-coil domain-containing protein 96-like [Tribolium madens]|uniref:coiled-coil domain-containing protein 96-like n=1 Tax=Tribolium madens TaxID=41895 RepID=UPI001CF7299D|nr:coiled-coil domain-containing protein 96-like [Tribolium madens]